MEGSLNFLVGSKCSISSDLHALKAAIRHNTIPSKGDCAHHRDVLMAKPTAKTSSAVKLPTASDLSIIANKRAEAPLSASVLSLIQTKSTKAPISTPASTVITPAGTPYLAAAKSCPPQARWRATPTIMCRQVCVAT